LRILITGAEGFAGRHLAPHLLEQGHEVYGTILRNIGLKPPLHEKLVAIPANLNNYDTIAEAFEIAKPDWVFHLAAISNLPKSFMHAMDAWKTNMIGSLHVFEAARKASVRMHILFVSSAAVYGTVTEKDLPLSETAELRPAEPYGASKAAGEMAAMQFRQSFGLRIVRVRSFNHTGPGQPPQFVVSEFARTIAMAEAGKAPPVMHVGNLRATRDLTDVRDVIKAYILLLKKGMPGDVYNVCSGTGVVIRDVLDMMLSMSPVKFEIKTAYEKIRPVELPVLVGDNRKIREEIGWEPAIPLEKTLRDSLDWWREEISSEEPPDQPSGDEYP